MYTFIGAKRDEDGYLWITGRVDDMLNVSGHLLSTAQVESALIEHEGKTKYCSSDLRNSLTSRFEISCSRIGCRCKESRH